MMSREMHSVKSYLFARYGCYCEVCGRKFKPNELTGHHIIMKCKGGKINRHNIMLACHHCHFVVINSIPYNTKEYWRLMWKSLAHRDPEDIGNFPYSNLYKLEKE